MTECWHCQRGVVRLRQSMRFTLLFGPVLLLVGLATAQQPATQAWFEPYMLKSLYLASVGSTGWPYIQHRGGPKGLLKVVDDRTMAFADFSGNKQFISAEGQSDDQRSS